MSHKPIQDYYPDNVAQCYGCGRLNEHGLQIKSYWDGDETVCHFRPRPYHTAIPGYVYGGLIASLIDCHATGTAAAAMSPCGQRSIMTSQARSTPSSRTSSCWRVSTQRRKRRRAAGRIEVIV
jgi:hypothetical protein